MSKLIKWIGCRQCDSPDCTGCNVYILEQALMGGVFDDFMEHGTVRVESVEERLKTEPVVRCQECKWFDGQELCERHGFFVGLDLSFFCKSGKRREEEHE